MKRWFPQRCLLPALVCAATTVSAAENEPPPALFDDPVVARGEGVEIRRSELEDAFVTYKANLAARGQAIPSARRTQAEASLLNRLIITEILAGKATEEQRDRAREQADAYYTAAEERAGSPEEFRQQLVSLGMSPEKLRKRVQEQALAELVIDQEVRPRTEVTDAEVRSFYEANPARFEEPPKVRASHILLSTKDPDDANPNPTRRKELPPKAMRERREKMQQILERARSGEDFQALAREYSDDPSVKENEGEYTFSRGAMVGEFEAAAFSMEPGQISDIVTTMFGFHIIKLHEKIPARTVPLEAATDDIREFLIRQKVEERLPEYFERLKREAKVEITDARLKDVLPETPDDAGEPVPSP